VAKKKLFSVREKSKVFFGFLICYHTANSPITSGKKTTIAQVARVRSTGVVCRSLLNFLGLKVQGLLVFVFYVLPPHSSS